MQTWKILFFDPSRTPIKLVETVCKTIPGLQVLPQRGIDRFYIVNTHIPISKPKWWQFWK